MPIYKMPGKKDGKQKYKVRVNYIDSYGKYKQMDRIAYGAEEAKELECQLIADSKEKPTSCKLTLNELYDEFIRAKTYELRESTVKKLADRLKRHVLSYLGDTRVDKLTIPQLQQWKISIEEYKSEKTGEKLSLTYKQSLYANFREFLNYAVQMKYIPKNLLLNLGNFKDPYNQKRKCDYYTAEEYRTFSEEIYKCASESEAVGNIYEWHFFVFFSIAFYTGLRKGEIHALRWSDIDSKNILHVTKSISQKLKGDDRETPPKNNTSIRDLQLPLPLIKILSKHKERCSKLDGFSQDSFICGFDKPLRDTTVDKKNKKYAEEAGLKKIRIHDFRHSHASLLANEGINIQEIARRLGHSNIEITWNTYSHLYPREEERAIQILNKI